MMQTKRCVALSQFPPLFCLGKRTSLYFFLECTSKPNVRSSNVNEVIRAVLDFFIYLFIYLFFYKKILHVQKAQNAYKRTKTKKAAFLCAQKTSKGKKVAYLLICVFLRFILFILFMFLVLFVLYVLLLYFVFALFMLFVRVKSFRKKE